MKKILTLCLCCLLPFSAAFAESADPLVTRGLALIQDMDELAESDAYCQVMSGSEEILTLAQQIGAAEYGAPKAVYRVTFSEDLLPSLFGDVDLSAMPDGVRRHLIARCHSALSSQLCAVDGALTLATASVLTVEDAFLDDLGEDVLYVYLYDGDYSAAVSYAVGSESIVQATAQFIPTHILTDFSDLGLSSWLDADAYSVETIQ